MMSSKTLKTMRQGTSNTLRLAAENLAALMFIIVLFVVKKRGIKEEVW